MTWNADQPSAEGSALHYGTPAPWALAGLLPLTIIFSGLIGYRQEDASGAAGHMAGVKRGEGGESAKRLHDRPLVRPRSFGHARADQHEQLIAIVAPETEPAEQA